MAFPVIAVTDNFTGTDNTSPPSANWSNSYNTLKILSNTCAGSAAADWNIGTRNNLTIGGNKCEIYCTIPTLPADNERVVLVLANSSQNGYMLEYQKLAGTDTVKLWKYTSGWYGTQIGSAINQDFAAGDALGVYVNGSTIKAYRKPSGGSWAQLGSDFTDSSYSSCSIPMLWVENTTTRVDDFAAGDPTPAAAITGTATASITESDIVTGGKTIIITLTNDTWRPA
jgi:hypothetical protein